MDLERYERFRRLQEQGVKSQATEALREFIRSFVDDRERRTWTSAFLNEIRDSSVTRIRHELFEEIVFPSLLCGYGERDPFSLYWLARLSSMIFANPRFWDRIDRKSEIDLLEEALEIEPDNTLIRERLLGAHLAWIDDSQHEWPAGILYGVNGATLEECQEMKSMLPHIRALDAEGRHAEGLALFETRLDEYIQRRQQE